MEIFASTGHVYTELFNIKGSPINAFVLGTIAATYLKGTITKRVSFSIVASLIATAFSFLMFLAYLASGELSFSIFGIITFPHLLKYFVTYRRSVAYRYG